MQVRILDELQRPDLATHVQAAIQDAIKHYQRRATAENQATLSTITGVEGTREYSLPSDFSRMIGDVFVVYGSVKEPLEERSIQELDELDDNPSDPETGVPAFFAIFGPTPDLHVVPRPDANSTYTFTGRYVSTLAAPDEDDDEGWWMNEAERVIRCYAKAIVYDDVLQYADQAEREFAKAEAEWLELVTESESRAFSAGVRPWGVY